MKKLTTILLMTLMVLSFVFAGGSREAKADNSLDDVLKKGVFVLGLDDSFPPMGYRDDSGEIVGFDIDVAKEVCNRLGVKLKCQPIDWDAKEQELATKQIDCIWNGFTVTEERRKAMTFSDAYVNNAQVIVVKASSSYKDPMDLKGKLVGVQAGSSAAEAVEDTPEFAKAIKGTVEFADNLTALMDLEIGGCEAVVMDLLVANFAISESGKDFRILAEGLTPEQYAIGFRLGEVKLAQAVNEKMLEMAKDGTLAKISQKWFGADITIIGK